MVTILGVDNGPPGRMPPGRVTHLVIGSAGDAGRVASKEDLAR